MQIVEKSGEGLSKVFSVTVPMSDLVERLDAKIAEITPTLNIKGFRPGKVPQAHVRKLYGKSIMSEVVEQTLNETTQKVLEENKLRPAGDPDLTPNGDMAQVIDGKADLAYDIAIEVMPEFEPTDLTKISLKRPVYEPTDAEVDEAVDELAKQNRTYETRTGKTVKAKDGDMVVIDFIGRADGVAFEGGTGVDTELVLGSGSFIPGFEEQLVGAKPDDKVMVKVTFPAEYQAPNLAGKDAEFETTVKEVKAPVESKADDGLAERLGVESLEKLRELLKTNLEGQYSGASRFKLKRALLDVLDEKHDFPLPPKMVEAEFAQIWGQVQSDKERGTLPPEDLEKTDDVLQTEYRKIAERRVRLGLVLAEIGRVNNVQITDQELAEAMRAEAMRYGPQAQQIFDFFRQNPAAQAQLRAPIFEDKVVDLIIEQAKVKDEKVSKDDLLKEDDMPAGYGA
ncbi:MAG: trigger factor [Phenylobacterium sp.]|uniref:trigger factor n=1 Tax=Phenylobacterium sp. TaxID=1871053 RepID=UPI00271F18D7|nr:trigger factor [Phenylobacterium sp.]MDO8913079.1 trigger factor [Phenylobacterium sp.]MDP2010451.1 trigger factor [Phenylobacterium sp.]MDP3101387.1 trigger factor [Phenylobacterium sp.]MDP3868175.1 trigger factor [Phenylobacterium sp.]